MFYNPIQLRAKLDFLRSHRHTLEYEWARTLRLVRPSRASYAFFSSFAFNNQSPQQRQSLHQQRAIFDNHGSTASLMLASYLHSSLTNPHDTWMSLTEKIAPQLVQQMIENDPKQEDGIFNDRKVLQFLSSQVHLEWQGTNFHQEIFSFYKSLVDLGTAVLQGYFVTEKGASKMMFRSKSLFNVYFLEDHSGRPNHVFCLYNKDARQLVAMFVPENMRTKENIIEMLGERAYKSYMNWDNEVYTFVHCVLPNYEDGKSKYVEYYFLYDAQHLDNMNNRKQHWDYSNPDEHLDKKEILAEKNVFLAVNYLDYQPYIITRIRKEPDQEYGSGFSTEAFPQLVQLQEIQRSITIAAQKNMEPPLNVPTSRIGIKFSSQPNAQNPIDQLGTSTVGVTPSIPQIEMRGPMEVKRDIKFDLDRIYLIDKIQLETTRRNRTATEVQKRTGEEIKLLSPFLGSLENEFLAPLTEMTLGLLRKYKNKVIIEALNRLDTLQYGFKYTSDIAKAQTESVVQKLVEGSQYLKVFGEADKKVMKLLDWVKTGRHTLEQLNVPGHLMKSPQEFKASVEEQAAQDAKANEMANAANVKDSMEAGLKLQEAETVRQDRIQGQRNSING